MSFASPHLLLLLLVAPAAAALAAWAWRMRLGAQSEWAGRGLWTRLGAGITRRRTALAVFGLGLMWTVSHWGDLAAMEALEKAEAGETT